MNVNILFVPQISLTTNSGIVIPSEAHGAYIGGGNFGGMNTPSTYHMRPMSPYKQQHFPPQPLYPQHAYYYYQQTPRYFYNQNYPTMNKRLPAPTQELPQVHGGFNTMSSNSNNNINNSKRNSNNNAKNNNNCYQKQQQNNNTKEMAPNNKVESSSASPTTSLTSKKKNNKKKNNKNKKQTDTKENVGEMSINDEKNTNNKEIIIQKPPQIQQKSKNTSMTKNAPAGNNKKTLNKQSTAFSKLKISDSKSSTNSPNTPLKIVNKDIKNQKNKNDTMQRNNIGKLTQTSTKSHHNKDQHNIKNDSSDSALPAKPHNRHHQQYYNNRNNNSTTAKQRKPRNGNKNEDAVKNTQNANTANGQNRRSSSRFGVSDYFQNGAHNYERRLISSAVEDNMISRHSPAHRNSTSSEASRSDDINFSSSNEDLRGVQNKLSKKSTQSKQKKQQQKRKQLGVNGNNIIVNTAQPMDIDEESKENLKPDVGKEASSAVAINLRKQCTKAAAFKAALNNTKFAKCTSNALTTSASNSSTFSSMSSSASNSPTHSSNSSPTASPTASKRYADYFKTVAQTLTPSFRNFTKLEFNEHEFVQEMKGYVIDPSLLKVYGFPIESVHHEGCIEIYKCLPKHLAEEAISKDNKRHHRHFYGRKKSSVVNANDGLYSGASCQQWSPYYSADSGNGSGDSSPRFTDSDSSEMAEDENITPIMSFYTPDGVHQIFSEYHNSNAKQCVRCSKLFQVNEKGEYLTFESCTYHWGKLRTSYIDKCCRTTYTCCQGVASTVGCSQHRLHVWNGTIVGANGPYTNFVHTQRKDSKYYIYPKVYAIDCEMSYTGLGLEVTKVTIVGYDGSIVYEHFVRPQADIIDYNTRFSGITEKDLSTASNNSIKTFAELQQDLLNLFDADTILIGHGLDNDLRVLRLVHKTVVDTSLVFTHSTGYPYRRSLRTLAKAYLGIDIQCGDMGHNSSEDSRACLELMMYKVREDWKDWSRE